MPHLSAVVHLLATNHALWNDGTGLAVPLLPLSAFAFLITRRGISAARRTGPANYAGGMYLGLLVFRGLRLAGGAVGLVLMGMAKL
jgi:hypothetical protein